MQIRAPGHFIGKSVSDVNIPGEIDVSVIERMGKPFIPVSGTSFEENDQLHVVIHQMAMNRFKRMMGLESS